MPSAVSPNPRAAPQVDDDLDDLFNYDAGIADVLNNQGSFEQNDNTTNVQSTRDIDEEVKITKRRQPVAKLDEERLLSQYGIPKLRKIGKDHLRFRGKGHEFSDMARLLNTYQLWLDNLYPRAKFADGLSMVEKLGHSKRMQIMRRQWIDEGKPKPVDDLENTEMQDDAADNGAEQTQQGKESDNASEPRRVGDDFKMSGALPDEDSARVQQTQTQRERGDPGQEQARQEAPEEDELDALLAEDADMMNGPASLFGSGSGRGVNMPPKPPERNEDEFADEEEAMAGMDW